ncbi:hypothetical protein N7501_011809 [Penicillium viridicatum]|nr:hypothetical protein N7501_011809 [Penicillium viridicatum]
MHNRGLATEAISTPSVGTSSPDQGLYADIEHTYAVLKEMVEAGRQIVVVNHSYGGLVSAGAVEGLGYVQRCKAGLPGGVLMVVWLAAFVMLRGKTVMDMLGGNLLPWMIIKTFEEDTVFYNDMSLEEQQRAISKLKPHTLKAFHEPASMNLESFAATLDNPVTYHVDTSHSAFLSMPDKVIDGLEVALKEVRQQSGIAVNYAG